MRIPARQTAVVLIACAFAMSANAQVDPQWALSRYQVRVVVLLDVPPTAEKLLQASLPRHLDQRATAAIGALWSLEVVLPQAKEAHQIEQVFDDMPGEMLQELASDCDKLMLLEISSNGMGYHVRSRTYDTFVQRWTGTVSHEVATLAEVPETAFWAVRENFAPVAYFQTIPGDDEHVALAWKGSALPVKDDATQWIRSGELLAPILRRVDRDGKALEDGTEQVPWTYFEIADAKDAKVRVWSHTKRPFGARRRGRVDQNAILVRGPLEPVTVRLESRIKEDAPLAGFDLFRQIPGEEATTPIGKSNLQGEINISPGKNLLEMIYVKSGSQVLAKLPIAFSTDQYVSVPLVDDPARLEAEGKINAIREELIDLVARRKILASRIEKQIEAKDLKMAEQLLKQLEELPGRAQFDQMLARQEQLSRSGNKMVQARIDKLFADTRAVLGHFLDARQTADLRNQINQAR